MAESYNKGDTDPEQYKHAEDAARSLITQVDLPLLIRCQALCVLGSSSNENDFLRYAEEAVHFAEVAVQQEGEPKDEGKKSDLDVANFMLESCQKILEGARKLKAQQEQEEQQEEQEQHEEQEQQEDFEVLWDPAWTDEHKARMKASCSAKPDEEKKWSIPWMDSRAPTRR
jgi:hypothetical protein